MADSYGADYAGALRVPLVNRERLLENIKQAILDRPHPWVFYITGFGGMGKTYLVKEVLARLQKGGSWYQRDILAASAEVDLYHTDTHSPEGLMRAMRAVLKPGLGYFSQYLKERDRLESYRQNLEGAQYVARQRQFLADAFVSDFERLTSDRRAVLVLDTAEVLLYEIDDIQRLLDLGEAGIEARGWLIHEFLPRINNSVVLIAGRPEPPPLLDDLRRALGDRLREVALGPLEEQDTLAYFDGVAGAARGIGRTRTAEQISGISEDTRRVIHLYTGGQPILLSLMIDYLTMADRLLPAVRVSLQEAQRQTPEELEQTREAVAGDVVRAIQEANRPADRAILALAWARRGLDAELLGKMIQVEPDEAQVLLSQLAELSFVKVRPLNDIFFLQDEMYGLLQRYSLDMLLPMEAEQALETLVRHSTAQVDGSREDYRNVQEEYFSHGQVSPARLAEARLALQRAITDDVHYKLRFRPIEGFEWYYRYAEEAFQAREESLDLEIRDELLQFLHKARPEERALIQDRATWDAGIRWVKRRIVKGDYPRAQEITARLRSDCAHLMQAAGPLAETELDIWEGWLLSYRGLELERAEQGLRRALTTLDAFAPDAETFEAWYRQVLLANAQNNLGYLLRVRGRFREAIEHYQAALPLWRSLRNQAEHANTLNNLAWALAEVGEFDQALRYAQDGLEMRQRLGPRYPVALSLNTLGLIQVRNDQPSRAQENCEVALTIFRELEQRRGIGLACIALAEALRRKTQAPGLRDPERKTDSLRQAEGYAREAMEIFTEEVAERPRLVEALIELGCIYREWARLRPQYQSQEDGSQDELAERGEFALRRAAEEAHDLFTHKEVDALVNLAWLRFYVNDSLGARQIIEGEVYPLAEGYSIVENQGLPQVSDPNAFLWVQLGKGHLLLGQIAFERYRREYRRLKQEGQDTKEAARDLWQAAQDYTLSIAHDELFANDFRDLRAGLDTIYRSLRVLNPEELQIVYEAVKQTAADYSLDRETPCRMQVFLEKSFGLKPAT